MSVGVVRVGLATPLGLGVEDTLSAWPTDRDGLVPNHRWPPEGLPRQDAGLVPGFRPRRQLPNRKAVKLMSREAQLAVFASVEAAGPSAPERFHVEPRRFGGFAAAGYEVSSLEESEELLALSREPGDPLRMSTERLFGPGRDAYNPLSPLKILPNMALFHAAVTLDLRGPQLALGSSPAAGLAAAIEATEALSFDEADAALVLGSDAQVEVFRTHQLVEAGVPLAPGEGAAALVLRRVDGDEPRILGFARGQERPSSPDPRDPVPVDPAARAALHRAALEAAGLDAVDLIFADLWGSPERDALVRQGLPEGPCCSSRQRLGWLGAAAGLVDLAIAVERVRRGELKTALITASGLAGDLAAVVVGAP